MGGGLIPFSVRFQTFGLQAVRLIRGGIFLLQFPGGAHGQL